MNLEEIQVEIQNKEDIKEELFDKLIAESQKLYKELEELKLTSNVQKPDLPPGVVGRRLEDKIYNLQNTIEKITDHKKSSAEDIKNLENAFNLVLEHLKQKVEFEVTAFEDSFTEYLNKIKKEIQSIKNLEKEFVQKYIGECKNKLLDTINDVEEKTVKVGLKQSIETYELIEKSNSYKLVRNLMKFNNEAGTILSIAEIAQEYKKNDDLLWKLQNDYEKVKTEKEELKEVARHLTQYEKAESKAKTYMDESEKHSKKLEDFDEDSRNELEDLINSYKEAHKLMLNEMEKIKQEMEKYGVQNLEEYNEKLKKNQNSFVNLEIEIQTVEEKLNFIEGLLNDLQECKNNAEKES